MAMAVSVSLFERLGGRKAIQAVVEEFYRRVLDDQDLKGYFKSIDMVQQKRKQVDFMTVAFGGPNEYTGRSMKESHDRLGISEQHFGSVAVHLVETLQGAGVKQGLIDEVVSLVAPLKADIVTV